MRINIPTLPTPASSTFIPSHSSAQSQTRILQAAESLARFLEDGGGKTVALTGAGISVDSGIRAYRGEKGSYTINKSYRPIFYNELMTSHLMRQRYWARSYLGYPPVRFAEPNKSHFAVAALQMMGYLKSGLITQNVDRLHHKALLHPSVVPSTTTAFKKPSEPILEIHGTLALVHCTNCGHQIDRNEFQDQLGEMNPEWKAFSEGKEGKEVKTNPDGDAHPSTSLSYSSFQFPPCPSCGEGPLKPSVVFFGENIRKEVKAQSSEWVDDANRMLVVGSSLATFSAFRLVKQVHDAGKPVTILNLGQTRADDLIPSDSPFRIDLESTSILSRVALALAETKGGGWKNRVQEMLDRGVLKAVDGEEVAS